MKTEQILNVLRVAAWVAFFSSIISLVFIVVVMSIDLTNGLLFGYDTKTIVNVSGIDLSTKELRTNYLKEFICLISFGAALGLIHVQIWWKVKEILTKINVTNPFSVKIALLLERVAYLLLLIWILSLIGGGYTQWLSNKVAHTAFHLKFNMEFSYLFSAGIVYIVSQVYKRGAELQEEINYTI